MEYKVGQKVWIWRGDNDKPYSATITDLCGIATNGEYVWEFKHIDEQTGWRCSSGCGESDIYETQEEAERAYKKYLMQTNKIKIY